MARGFLIFDLASDFTGQLDGEAPHDKGLVGCILAIQVCALAVATMDGPAAGECPVRIGPACPSSDNLRLIRLFAKRGSRFLSLGLDLFGGRTRQSALLLLHS
jgi:hypothetical protein